MKTLIWILVLLLNLFTLWWVLSWLRDYGRALLFADNPKFYVPYLALLAIMTLGLVMLYVFFP
jgi:hypothetical protein